MLTISAHLGKEWREQRLVLGSAALVLLALALAVGWSVPGRLIPAEVEVWFTIVAVAAGLVILAGDLVPGEARRGQLAFLIRAPGALRAAFVAKGVVLCAGLIGLWLVGWASGALCSSLAGEVGERTARWGGPGVVTTAIAGIACGVAVAAPWGFAVSCWLPRGASVVPATALVLLVVCAPPVVVAVSYRPPLSDATIALSIVLLFAGGIVAAWTSFVRGLRCGRRRDAFARGALASLVFVVPTVGWSFERAWSWHHVDLDNPEVVISGGLIGDGGLVFLNANRCWSRSGPIYGVACEPESGRWWQIGPPQGWFREWTGASGSSAQVSRLLPQRWLGRAQLNKSGYTVRTANAVDGTTGAVLALPETARHLTGVTKPLQAAAATLPIEGRRTFARNATPFVLPDGTRAWFEGRTTVIESPAGTREQFAWPDGCWPSSSTNGFGFRWGRGGSLTNRFFDLARRRDVQPPPAKRWNGWPLARPGSWVVTDDPKTPGAIRGPYLFDPDTGAQRALPVDTEADFVMLCGDGRLILRREASPSGYALFDPEANEQIALTLDGPAVEECQLRYVLPSGVKRAARTPSGYDVCLAIKGEPQSRLSSVGRRDGNSLSLCPWVKQLELVGFPDDDHVLVIVDGRTLERWTFGSAAREVLLRAGGGGATRHSP